MDRVDVDDIVFVASGLHRPECVLPTRSGDLLVSDARGGYCIVREDGSVQTVLARAVPEGFMPNGIALLRNRDVLIANLGPAGGVYQVRPDGKTDPFLTEIDGKPLPPTNFVGLDGKGRVWITVSTWKYPRELAFNRDVADGFIIMVDDAGARIVADGIAYTNEAIVDPTGQWLYVNETIGRRTSRFALKADGSLGAKELVCEYPAGTFPDGFTFDETGAVWCVSVSSNRVFRVSADGRPEVILEDQDAAEIARVAAAYEANAFGRSEMDAGRNRPLKNLSSIGFGGSDLKTVFLGSLQGEALATFRSPIAGAPPVHWEF